LIGLGIFVFGFLRVVAAADALGILVGVAGSIVWQCGTFLEERSPEFRALNSTLARDVMRTGRINVPGWLKVGKLREQLPASNGGTFFVTIQDGYESGIVLPEHLQAVSDDEARYLPIGQVARPISFVDSIRGDDSLLTALVAMDRYWRDYVLVLDRRERIAGAVTRNEIAGATKNHQIEPAWTSAGRPPVEAQCEAGITLPRHLQRGARMHSGARFRISGHSGNAHNCDVGVGWSNSAPRNQAEPPYPTLGRTIIGVSRLA
jgi:hypothetical protein